MSTIVFQRAACLVPERATIPRASWGGGRVGKRILLLLIMCLTSASASVESRINVLWCKLYIPNDFEAVYRSDGSISFTCPGSSINIGKYSERLKGGVNGDHELTATAIKEYGISIAEGERAHKKQNP